MRTMWRPRSDIGRIQYRDVLVKYDQGLVEEITIHIREPKESQQKSSQLGLLEEKSKELSVVRTLSLFFTKHKNL